MPPHSGSGGVCSPQAMELLSVSQQVEDLDETIYAAEKEAGHVAAPMMAGLAELLHKLQLDTPEHNPFVDAAPVTGALSPA